MNNPIKWSGSKRYLSSEIISHFPNNIETFYEPFCGSCAVTFALAVSDNNIGNFVCSDINGDLINLWNCIKYDFEKLFTQYESLWLKLNSYQDVVSKKLFYKDVRTQFNSSREPSLFLFLLRTCYNGLVRYNSRGDFNSPFHFFRPGINPLKMKVILEDTNKLINNRNIIFKQCAYSKIDPSKESYCFFDPPYSDSDTMYYGKIDENVLFAFLNDLPCGYSLTFNSTRSDEELDLHDVRKVILRSRNSSFSLLKGNVVGVRELLYIKDSI